MPKRTFAAIVQRTDLWDPAREAHLQDGFAQHAEFVASLERDGFIAMAGLMQPSDEVLFIFLADNREEIYERMSQDPWQRSGRARLIRVEEIHIRIGAPQQHN